MPLLFSYKIDFFFDGLYKMHPPMEEISVEKVFIWIDKFINFYQSVILNRERPGQKYNLESR